MVVTGESIVFLRCLYCEDNLSFSFLFFLCLFILFAWQKKEYFWVLKVFEVSRVLGPEKGA